MHDYPFTKQTDAPGHNVLGVTFDTPLPWAAFDGPGATIGDEIALALTGGRAALEEKRDALAGALEDLASEIEEETDGDLKLAKTGVEEARDLLRKLRGTFHQATRAFEAAQKAAVRAVAQAGDAGPKVREAIREADAGLHVARTEALRLLFDPETIEAIGEALAVLDGVETRIADAVTDLTKQAEDARATWRDNIA